MSRVFGEIRQNGYVVRDIEFAMQHWTRTIGVGPFFCLEHVTGTTNEYRGVPTPIEVSIAVANSGPLQIELVQQHNDAPSIYRDFLAQGHEGLHHVGVFSDAMDADLERIRAAGYETLQSGHFDEKSRFAYFATEGHPGTIVELLETSGQTGRFFEAVARAARDWDGSGAIHRIRMTD